jgi:hypothetical protein
MQVDETKEKKLYYRVIALKAAWYCQRNRYEDKWNRIKDPDMNPDSYTHQIFYKSSKTYNGEKIASSTNVA